MHNYLHAPALVLHLGRKISTTFLWLRLEILLVQTSSLRKDVIQGNETSTATSQKVIVLWPRSHNTGNELMREGVWPALEQISLHYPERHLFPKCTESIIKLTLTYYELRTESYCCRNYYHCARRLFAGVRGVWNHHRMIKKDIPEFEGLYAITRSGRIWSYAKKPLTGNAGRKHNGKWLSPWFTVNGYPIVELRKRKGGLKTFFVHRLVALVYIPNPKNLPWINHKNGIQGDHSIKNLEWCTPGENARHAIRTGLNSVGVAHIGDKPFLTEMHVRKIRRLRKTGYTVKEICTIMNVSMFRVYDLLEGRTYKDII